MRWGVLVVALVTLLGTLGVRPSAAQEASDPSPSGVVGRWRLGERSGVTAVDSSATGGNGSYDGAPSLGRPGALEGDADTAVGFDGVDDGVTVAYDARHSADRGSVEAWVRTVKGYGPVVARGNVPDGSPLRLEVSGGKVYGRFRVQGASAAVAIAGTSVVDEGRWHHLALTYDGAVARLYVDGVEEATRAFAGKLVWAVDEPLTIGYQRNCGGCGISWFRGDIDEVAYYDTPLTPQDIADHIHGAGRVTAVQRRQTFGCQCGNSLGAPNHTALRADPVNTATGAFSEVFSDLALPGNGVTFAMGRSYTSADTTAGPMGPGWTHPYNTSLLLDANGDVRVRAEDGQQARYARQTDGSYLGPPAARPGDRRRPASSRRRGCGDRRRGRGGSAASGGGGRRAVLPPRPRRRAHGRAGAGGRRGSSPRAGSGAVLEARSSSGRAPPAPRR